MKTVGPNHASNPAHNHGDALAEPDEDDFLDDDEDDSRRSQSSSSDRDDSVVVVGKKPAARLSRERLHSCASREKSSE